MEVKKSPRDNKDYRAITLDNGIAVLLISDNRTIHASSRTKLRREDSEDDLSGEDGIDEEEDCDDDSEEEACDGHVSSDGSHVTGKASTTHTVERSPEKQKSNRVRAACGVCIRTGSFCDPPEIPGLAHLLEHMVFMGSEKYHGENTFDAFTNEHGGHDNASTDYERTVFQFCVHPEHFQKGLDMFAHFFASPLLLKQSLDREIEAVDNEFQMAIQSDTDRSERMIATLAKPTHPLSSFVWGNSESLRKTPRKKGVNLVKRLKDYYRRNYSSHYMTVAAMSCYSLDTLEQWVRESFSTVPHNGLPCPSFAERKDTFDDSSFCKLFKIVPVKDMHKVNLTWILPCMYNKYKSKPMQYLSWLLGHEGEGSVFAYLKKMNLATSLCAGNGGMGYEYNSCFSLFSCSITLTDKGFDEAFKCITLVFQYLKLLAQLGPQERIFREIQDIKKNDFDFKEEEEPIDFVEWVCEMMELYPVEEYLTGDDLLFDYDPDSISSTLELLASDKANIMWFSKRFSGQCGMKEKWFKIEYSKEDIPSEWRTAWQNLDLHPDLHLPKPNSFIATDFSLKAPDLPSTKYPVVIDECTKYKLWYKKANSPNHDSPRGWVCLLLRSPLYLQSPQNATLMQLFLYLYLLNISEVAYTASAAQLHHSIDIVHSDISIALNGFNHKITLLFEELINYLAKFETTNCEESFTTAKEQLKKFYSNNILRPKKLCKMSRLKVLEHCDWNARDKLKIIDGLTLSSLQEFVCQFKKHLFVEALIQGNITAQEARGMMVYLNEHLEYEPLLKEFQTKPRAMQLPSNTAVCYQLSNRDKLSPSTVIIDYYQCCQKTVRDMVIADLVSVCMDEPCFNELRTKQQLGYSVYMTKHDTHGVVGLSLTLVTQGTKHSAEYAGECMDKFIHQFYSVLLGWSHDQFQSQRDALIQEKQQPDLSVEEEMERHWAEVISCSYQFDMRELEVLQLQTVSQEEVCEWLHRYTHPGESYRKLSVKVVSCSSPVERSSSDETLETLSTDKDPSSETTSPIPSSLCPKCSHGNTALLPGESSVDPPQSSDNEQLPHPSQVLLFERDNEEPSVTDSSAIVDLERFRSSMFVYPCSVLPM